MLTLISPHTRYLLSFFTLYLCLYRFPLVSETLFSLCPSRPGVLKDLKTMGSISLFIFFITLLVLARQVSPHYNSLNDVIVCHLHIFTFTPLKEFSFQLCSYITIALFTFSSVCLPFHHLLYLSKVVILSVGL